MMLNGVGGEGPMRGLWLIALIPVLLAACNGSTPTSETTAQTAPVTASPADDIDDEGRVTLVEFVSFDVDGVPSTPESNWVAIVENVTDDRLLTDLVFGIAELDVTGAVVRRTTLVSQFMLPGDRIAFLGQSEDDIEVTSLAIETSIMDQAVPEESSGGQVHSYDEAYVETIPGGWTFYGSVASSLPDRTLTDLRVVVVARDTTGSIIWAGDVDVPSVSDTASTYWSLRTEPLQVEYAQIESYVTP